MSATVTEKTKRGPIQLQKFQRFLRSACPRRLAVTRGKRDQPTDSGFRRPLSSQSLDETSISLAIYPNHWLSARKDPFSQRRSLDYDAWRWYR